MKEPSVLLAILADVAQAGPFPGSGLQGQGLGLPSLTLPGPEMSWDPAGTEEGGC